MNFNEYEKLRYSFNNSLGYDIGWKRIPLTFIDKNHNEYNDTYFHNHSHLGYCYFDILSNKYFSFEDLKVKGDINIKNLINQL